MVQKSSRGKIWLMVLLVAVAGVVFGLLWYLNPHKDKEATSGDVKTELVTEDETKEVSDDKNDDVLKKVVQYEGEDPNDAEELSGVVTYAGLNEGILRIRLNIDQFLSGGSCDLKILADENVVYTESVAIIGNVSAATCEGFDIDWGEVGVNGEVKLEILLASGGKNGKIIKEVSL